jgi:hypothetical protein
MSKNLPLSPKGDKETADVMISNHQAFCQHQLFLRTVAKPL